MMDHVSFDRRIHISAPGDFTKALRAAAGERGLSVADYVRAAVSEALSKDGVKHRPPPCLHRHGPSGGRSD